MLQDFGISGVGAPITSVEVDVNARYATDRPALYVQLSFDGGVKWTPTQSITTTTSLASYTVSGKWGREWRSSELSNANFRVLLTAIHPATNSSGQIQADYVRVRVSHG